MKRDDWTAGSFSARPAGKPDECFYCGVKLGQAHAVGCVVRTRTILVRTTIEHVVTVPENWDENHIYFYHNEGTGCGDNQISRLEELVERLDDADRCTCGMIETEFVREATAEDEERCLKFVKDEES
jgi:hypothetical protein